MPRLDRAPSPRGDRIPKDLQGDDFDRNFIDSDDFDAYCVLVRSVIYAAHDEAQREAARRGDLNWRDAQRPLCTRDIHKALGDQARQHWTADALLCIGDVEECGLILPTRYRPTRRSSTSLQITHSQTELNARLFAETYSPIQQEEKTA